MERIVIRFTSFGRKTTVSSAESGRCRPEAGRLRGANRRRSPIKRPPEGSLSSADLASYAVGLITGLSGSYSSGTPADHTCVGNYPGSQGAPYPCTSSLTINASVQSASVSPAATSAAVSQPAALVHAISKSLPRRAALLPAFGIGRRRGRRRASRHRITTMPDCSLRRGTDGFFADDAPCKKAPGVNFQGFPELVGPKEKHVHCAASR